MTEVLDQRMGQRNVLVKARNVDNNILSLLKIRYQLDPKIFGFSGDEEILEIAEDHFLHEVQCAALLNEAGLGSGSLGFSQI